MAKERVRRWQTSNRDDVFENSRMLIEAHAPVSRILEFFVTLTIFILSKGILTR